MFPPFNQEFSTRVICEENEKSKFSQKHYIESRTRKAVINKLKNLYIKQESSRNYLNKFCKNMLKSRKKKTQREVFKKEM